MELVRQPPPAPTVAGEVATFYSYKGGVGRTMALANVAALLTRRGIPVLMVDWDLDAPSLHYYFPGDGEHPGVLELFEACREQLRSRHGAAPDAELANKVLDAVGWEQYVTRVDQAHPLYLMRAGRLDGHHAERASRLDWQAMFDACPSLFRALAERMAARFSHVLIDSRSGRADSAGICTILLPTRLVLVFTPSRPQLDGLEALVARATTYRRSHEDEQRPLLVYPLPARIDAGDPALRALWRRGDIERRVPGYQPMFERALAEAYGYTRMSLEGYFDRVQLQQCGGHVCGEPLPALEEEGDCFSLAHSYEAFLGWFQKGLCPWEALAETPLPVAAPLAQDLGSVLFAPHELNNHHKLLAEQERASYWQPRRGRGGPAGPRKADLAEPG